MHRGRSKDLKTPEEGIEIGVKRVAKALERIATALEKGSDPSDPSDPAAIKAISDSIAAQKKETEEALKRNSPQQ